MRPLYCIYQTHGVFPHMLPYWEKFGGLVFTTSSSAYENFRREYPRIPITFDPLVANVYNPDIAFYADYVPIFANMKNVMVFHSIDLKGYYAINKDWNNCELFDLCLLYGDRVLDEFKNNGHDIKYEVIGYPRFDNIKNAPKNIFKNDKKTILIAPTWSDESLLKRFHNEIIELSKTYNILVKPHVLIGTEKDCNFPYIKKIGENISDTLKIVINSDILPFMVDVDMMITDYSGASCEFMYFDKPIIVADPQIELTKPDTWDACVVCEDPDKLVQTIKEQFENDTMKEQRNKYFNKLVYSEPGSTATERGILAVEKLMEAKK